MNRFGRRKEKRGTHTTLKSCSVWLLRRKTENLCKAAWKTMSPWDRQRRKRRKHDEILCVEGSLRQSRSSSGYSTITFDEEGGYYFSDPFPIIPSSLCIFYFYSQRLESTLSLAVSVHDFDYKEFFGKVMSQVEASGQATWWKSFAAALRVSWEFGCQQINLIIPQTAYYREQIAKMNSLPLSDSAYFHF